MHSPYIAAHAEAVAKEGGIKDAECIPSTVSETYRAKSAQSARRVHQIRTLHNGLQCSMCLKCASRPATVEAFHKAESEGSAASRLVLDELGNMHRLRSTGCS